MLTSEITAALGTLGAAVQHLRTFFTEGGMDNPTLDARLLVLAASGCSLNTLVANPAQALSSDEQQTLGAWAMRRLSGEPVARILGEKEFWGLPFGLDKETLVPRPDTETLIEAALALYPEPPRSILDLGTGTGCILLALLHEWPEAQGKGIDISSNAVEQAKRNAARLGFNSRTQFLHSDWDSALPDNLTFDLIISNPPYIPSKDIATLAPEVRLHDPMRALDGGADGLDDYRKIAALAYTRLKDGGWLVLELGIGQEADVTALLLAQGFTVPAPAKADLGGIARALCAHKTA